MKDQSKINFDIKAYNERVQISPGFICRIVAKDPEDDHHIVYEDENVIVFLNKYPSLYGYVLVSPKEHVENVTGDIALDDYLYLQKIIYMVSEAIKQIILTERIYILSVGSKQGNSHVHWHVAPLPPNVPYEKQQFEALNAENGILDLSNEQISVMTEEIRNALKIQMNK